MLMAPTVTVNPTTGEFPHTCERGREREVSTQHIGRARELGCSSARTEAINRERELDEGAWARREVVAAGCLGLWAHRCAE